jgi:hypothetical protein
MRIEDLVVGKKYRHPLFNFDLSLAFSFEDESRHVFRREVDGKVADCIALLEKEIEQLTEVREPIKKEQVSYSYINHGFSPTAALTDVITGLYVHESNNKINNLISSIGGIRNKSIVKHITTSIELTEEDIKKELENES